MKIGITLINEASVDETPDIVLYQKNIGPNQVTNTIAWRVVEHLATGNQHSFEIDTDYQLGAVGTDGKQIAPVDAKPGQIWNVEKTASGEQLVLNEDPPSGAKYYTIQNLNSKGSIIGEIYNNGLLIAKTNILDPEQNGTFEFDGNYSIGAIEVIKEGEVLNAAALSETQRIFNFTGIVTANIIMTGGGIGPNAMPYKFTMVPTS